VADHGIHPGIDEDVAHGRQSLETGVLRVMQQVLHNDVAQGPRHIVELKTHIGVEHLAGIPQVALVVTQQQRLHVIQKDRDGLCQRQPHDARRQGLQYTDQVPYKTGLHGLVDGFLVPEILVQRTDTDAGNVGNVLGGLPASPCRLRLMKPASTMESTVDLARCCRGMRGMGIGLRRGARDPN